MRQSDMVLREEYAMVPVLGFQYPLTKVRLVGKGVPSPALARTRSGVEVEILEIPQNLPDYCRRLLPKEGDLHFCFATSIVTDWATYEEGQKTAQRLAAERAERLAQAEADRQARFDHCSDLAAELTSLLDQTKFDTAAVVHPDAKLTGRIKVAAWAMERILEVMKANKKVPE